VVVQRFHEQWLGVEGVKYLEKDRDAFTPEISGLMQNEFRGFVDQVIWEKPGTLAHLLTAPTTVLNATLAAYYGVPGTFTDELQVASEDPARRAGILTQGALMATLAQASDTHPVARGLMVREKLFCQLPPPPPEGVNTELAKTDVNATIRQRLEQHRADPACAGCHALFDPIGLGLENFDALGRYQTVDDGGLAIDASGNLLGTDVDGPFVGATELAQKLSQSQDVADCAVRHWFRYAAGRTESPADRCNLEFLNAQFSAAQGNIQQLLLAVTQTDAFMFRQLPSAQTAPMPKPPQTEVSP
jgi:hypothetical protein